MSDLTLGANESVSESSRLNADVRCVSEHIGLWDAVSSVIFMKVYDYCALYPVSVKTSKKKREINE